MLVIARHERGMALVRLPLSFRATQPQRRCERKCLNSTNELAARRDIGSCFYGRTLVCVRCPLSQQAVHALLVDAEGGGGDCRLIWTFCFFSCRILFFLSAACQRDNSTTANPTPVPNRQFQHFARPTEQPPLAQSLSRDGVLKYREEVASHCAAYCNSCKL